MPMPGHDIIVLGASSGGLDALRKVVAGLPKECPAAFFIVQHIAPQSPFFLPSLLSQAGPLPARGAVDLAVIEPGTITVAPPDQHLLLEEGRMLVVRGPKENRSRPAIDPLFRTAARAYGPRVVGVVLTGNLDDGTAGLQDVKRRGGLAVVQDPAEALYPSMPRSARRFVQVDHVAALDDLGPLLGRLAQEPAATEGAPPVPAWMDVESRISAMQEVGVGSTDPLGTPSSLTCPECHGALTRIEHEGFLRFRCHEGHAYSARHMLDGQREVFERGLWDMIRLLEERAALHGELAEWSRQAAGDDDPTRRVAAEAARLKEEAERIRGMLARQDSFRGSAVSNH